jgi:SAM-dependent methyltransferase
LESPRHLAGGKPADAVDFVLERRHRLTSRLAPARGQVLLDFGCGNGAQTRWFEGDYEFIVGVDVNEGFLRELVRRRAEGGQSCAHGVRYDGRRLPLAESIADRIVSFEVLEHVGDERLALEEICRALKPGGQLVMSVPNRWWIFETHGADLPLLPWNRVPFFSWLPTLLHDRWARARIYRRRDITRKLEAVGLRVEHSTYVTAPMDVVRWKPLRDLLRRTIFRSDSTSLPFLATAVLVVARRPE